MPPGRAEGCCDYPESEMFSLFSASSDSVASLHNPTAAGPESASVSLIHSVREQTGGSNNRERRDKHRTTRIQFKAGKVLYLMADKTSHLVDFLLGTTLDSKPKHYSMRMNTLF